MLQELFHTSATRRAGHTALITRSGRTSYAELQQMAAERAAALTRAGLRAGARVALALPNERSMVVDLWATWLAGGVAVPLHPALKPDALRACIEDADPAFVIDVTGTQARRSAAHPHTTAPGSDTAATDAVRLAALLYTSGTTGEPKGVMHTHGSMHAGLQAVNAYLQLRESDTLYSALPLASSYGLHQLLMGLYLGATVQLDRSFAFPAHSLKWLSEERATVFAGVPTMYAWLAATPLLGQHDLSSLRLLTSAAAALPVAHALAVRQRLPAAQLFVMYGQTECKRISYLEPGDLVRKAGSVGRGMPMQELRVVDAEGRSVAADGSGELVVRGPHLMQGYWRKPEATAARLRPLPGEDGLWLHTGDQFRIDAEGFLWFQGRADEILKIGGHKVSPAEVEEVLCQMPEIAEAAVIGLPDAEWGQAAHAVVALREGAATDEPAILRHCRLRLRGFMVPKSVTIRAALPKTESGKIRKRELLPG